MSHVRITRHAQRPNVAALPTPPETRTYAARPRHEGQQPDAGNVAAHEVDYETTP